MAIYSLASRTSMVTIAHCPWELKMDATKRGRVVKMTITMAAATASVFGVGFPQAVSNCTDTHVHLQAYDPGEPASLGTVLLTFVAGGATEPTVPLQYFNRVNLPATIGAGRTIEFVRGLYIPVSSSLIIWNITANGIADVEIVVEE